MAAQPEQNSPSNLGTLSETERQQYAARMRLRYQQYLGREATDAELEPNLTSRDAAERHLENIGNSLEYLTLKETHPDWFNPNGTLKTGYTNQGPSAASGAGAASGGGSSSNYGTSVNLDPAYIEQQVRAAFAEKGVQNPSQNDVAYWVRKATTPDVYSDGKVRVGWNNYWKTKLITGAASADPNLAGNEGVISNPSQWGIQLGGGGSIDLNAPLNQQYTGEMPTVPTSAPLPEIPNAPAFQGPTWESVYQDPGYQFALKQGIEATQNAQAAKGMLHSGATLKALSGLGQQTATQFYNDAFTRGLNTYNTNYQTQYQNPYLARVNQWQLSNDAAQRQYQNQWAQYQQGYNQYRNWQSDVWNRQFGYATA